MRHVFVWATGLTLALGAVPVGATIYTWTDAQGVQHFSDVQARPDARAGNFSTRAAPPPQPASHHANARTAIERIRPRDRQLVADLTDGVAVAVALGSHGTGRLASHQEPVYYLDGHRLKNSPSRKTQFVVKRLTPGKHRLAVALQSHGRQLQRTPAVTFQIGAAGSGQSRPKTGVADNSGGPPS